MEYRVYVGTYTEAIRFGTGEVFQGKGEGIHVYRMFDDGALEPISVTRGTKNPSYLCPHPTGRFLYAVNELKTFEGGDGGTVSSFSMNPDTGKLTYMNRQPTRGTDPCHVVTDNGGRHVMVANYSSGSVSIYPVLNDGSLGPASDFVQHKGSSADPVRQTGPHAHSSVFDPANRFVFVPDLGLDRVIAYRYNADSGTLTEHSTTEAKRGAGPRHVVFDRDGLFGYLINELDSTLSVCRYESTAGTLTSIATTSTLPDDFSGESSCAEVVIHPSGDFVYASNRGHDTIAIFRRDRATGELTLAGYESTRGKVPRHFTIDPSGSIMLVANQSSDSIVSFSIDRDSGALTPTERICAVGTPVCVRVVPVVR